MSTPNVTTICADVLDWCESYIGPPFHCILCDPSYAMSKKKRLDMDAPVDTKIETMGDVVAAYHSLQQWGDTGFMNRRWDDSTAFDPETWRALAKHLHPGGFVMAFASSRGDHRLAVAMEDAGLVIHPKIFLWLNGQSFPKATRPFKKPKKWREVQHRWLGWMGKLGNWILRKWDSPPKYYLDFIFSGHRYGRQALKNCAEPIIVAQKPYAGRPVDSIVETGAGALNIDGGRVATGGVVANTSPSHKVSAGWDRPWRHDPEASQKTYEAKLEGNRKAQQLGRWPPNFVLCHVQSYHRCRQCQAVHPVQPVVEVCPDCGGELERVEGCKRAGVKRVRSGSRGKAGGNVPHAAFDGGMKNRGNEFGYADPDGRETVADWDCAEGCPARRLGEQSGERKDAGFVNPSERSDKRQIPIAVGGKQQPFCYGDKGTAARYYPQAGWECERIESDGTNDDNHDQAGGTNKEGEFDEGHRPPIPVDDGGCARPTGSMGTEMQCVRDPETGESICPVARLDEQAGERKSGGWPARHGDSLSTPTYSDFHGKPTNREGDHRSEGGASRFYPNADWTHEVAEQLAQADPVKYVPKAAKKERNEGLDDFYWRRDKASPTGFVRISQEEWESLPKRQRARGNIHPTVKPISLLVWLAKLLLPPPEYEPRRILVPFAGSGSEAIAAALTGFEEVVAVEMLQAYVDISEARAAFWLTRQLELPTARPAAEVPNDA